MRRITLFIIHCSATRCGQPYSFEDCRRDHIDGRHFRDIGLLHHTRRPGTSRPAALSGGGALLRSQPPQHRHLLRRGTGRQRPPGRHSHACPEGCPHAVVARAGPQLPGSSHRRTPRLEPPKGLSFVRRSERIQKRRTPWEALRPPRGASRLHGVVIVRVFPILLSSRSLFTDFQRGDVILGPRIADVLVDNATGIGCDRIIGDRP